MREREREQEIARETAGTTQTGCKQCKLDGMRRAISSTRLESRAVHSLLMLLIFGCFFLVEEATTIASTVKKQQQHNIRNNDLVITEIEKYLYNECYDARKGELQYLY